MPRSSLSEPITALLTAVSEGDAQAREQLWKRVYPDLKEIAHRELRRRRAGRTLQTTSLVNEAYLRLVGRNDAGWKDRVHFFALAATAMRHILIDYARSKKRLKRGGSQEALSLEEGDLAVNAFSEELLDLDAALDRLAAFDERAARVVECRFFAGLGVEDTAGALDIAPRTVKRDWAAAKAWLVRELGN